MISLLVICVFVPSCHSSWGWGRRPENIILEVIDQDGGMVCSTEKHLKLRVYANGWTEGDVFSGPCWPRLSKIFSSYRLRSSQLDPAQLEQLKTALNELHWHTSKDVYPQFAIGRDSSVSETIILEVGGTRRIVELVDPEPTDSRNKVNYPPEMINLLVRITEIRQHFDASAR